MTIQDIIIIISGFIGLVYTPIIISNITHQKNVSAITIALWASGWSVLFWTALK